MIVLLAGCASPGPPLPPSLKLPDTVSGLTASRMGGDVTLHWTTPSRTTDKLLIKGPITAEICRDLSGQAQPAGAARRVARTAGKTPGMTPCSTVARVLVTPGDSQAVDTLPASLELQPVRLLAYRVQLLNSAGRTAGPSPAVFAASGPAPPPVQAMHGTATKNGVVLEWKPEDGSPDAIEFDRATIDAPAGLGAAPISDRKSVLSDGPKSSSQSRLRAGAVDTATGPVNAAGTTDRTAQIGHTYRYSAYRVRTVVQGGHTLEVRSVPSPAVTVAMLEVFPPEVPATLVAVPGFAGQQGEKPAIDLSWDPVIEPRMAGYRVYRRNVAGADANTWQRLGDDLVPVAAYRDLAVTVGRKYAYRVTAVNEAGIESAQSGEVIETAPAQ